MSRTTATHRLFHTSIPATRIHATLQKTNADVEQLGVPYAAPTSS